MATYNPYAAQEADIARRKHMADVLEQQAFKPIQQFSYNGIPAPISPLSGLAKVLSSYTAGKLGREAAAAETKLGANRTAARARSVDMLVKAMGGTPKGEDTPATPGTDPSLGTTFEPVAEGHDPAERPVVIPGTMGTPAVLGAPAVRGGVTDALALSLEDPEIQGIALGLAKDERGREQALKLAQMTTDRATTVAQQKADTAVLLQEMKARAASGDTTQMKNYAFLQTLSSEDQDAFTVLFNRNSRSLTPDQAMEKTRLEIQGRLDVARLNNEGALNRTQLTLDARQLAAELQAKANTGGTAEMKNFNFYQGLSSEDKAVFTAEFNRQSPALTFEQRVELSRMGIQGRVDAANVTAAATAARVNATQARNELTDYRAAVEVLDKTGQWTGPPGSSPPQTLPGSPARAQEMQVAQLGVIHKDLDNKEAAGLAASKSWDALQRVRDLSDTASQGSLAPFRLAVADFFSSFNISIDPQAQNAGAQMVSAINSILSSQMGQLGARGLTNQDMVILKDNLPKLGTSSEARIAIAEVLQKSNYKTMSEFNNLFTGYKAQVSGLVRIAPEWLNHFVEGGFGSATGAATGAGNANPPPPRVPAKDKLVDGQPYTLNNGKVGVWDAANEVFN